MPLIKQPVIDGKISPAEGTTTANGLATTVIDTSRTEADDFWNGMALLITSGAYNGQVREITGWVLLTGTFTVAPAFGGLILTGVTYKILTQLPADVDVAAIEAKLDARLDAAVSTRATPAQVLAQIQSEMGVISGRTTLKTLLAILGWADTATIKTLAQVLYVSDTELLKDFIAKTGGTALPASKSLYDFLLAIPSQASPFTDYTTTRAAYLENINNAQLLNISSTILGRIDAAISSRSSHSAADVWSVATRVLSDYSGVWSVVTRALTDKANFTLAAAEYDNIRKSVCLTGDTASSIGKILYDLYITTVPAIKTQTDKIPRVLCSMDFWGSMIEELQLTAAEQANLTLGGNVVIAGLPDNITLVRVVVMFMCRAIENTNVAANKLNGAQNIEVGFAGANFIDAIALADDLFAVALSTREMGTVIIGGIDVKATVTGNGTCTFRIDSARADVANLNFNDYQVGVRVYFTV